MRRLLPWLLVALPLLAALALAAAMRRGVLPDLLFVGRYELSVATLVLVAGALLSLAALGVWRLRRWARRQREAGRVEAAALAAEERRQFLRRLDHELKNPLAITRLGVSNLRAAPPLSAEQDATLQRVAQQGERLRRVVEGLRQITELEEQPLEQERVALSEVLEEAVTVARERPAERAPSIQLAMQQLPWPVGPVRGDRDLLVMAFYNLLDNALKFSANGAIELRAAEDGRMAVVEIADAGPGIPAAELPHIWEELYRGESTRGAAEGSGLGLALVRRIVQLHEGEVAVRSRVGQGSAFVVRLPLALGD